MLEQPDQFIQQTSYPWEGLEEDARLKEQDDLLNKLIRFNGSLLPVAVTPGMRILDIGCGTGGWGLAIAENYPSTQVFGIDNDDARIAYATATAAKRKLFNIQFTLGDFRKISDLEKAILEPVDFGVARLTAWFTRDYDACVASWVNCLVSGGTMCLIEEDQQLTNSQAFNTMARHMALYIHNKIVPNLVGQGIAPVLSMTCNLRPALLAAGCREIQTVPFFLDFSAGAEAHDSYVRNLSNGLENVAKMLASSVPTIELQTLITRWKKEMWHNPNLRAITYFLAAYGQKPM